MTDFLVAESAIRQLHGRYIDAVWRKDYDAFKNLYAEDGEWKIAGRHLKGREAIAAQLATFMEVMDRVIMTFGIPVIEVGEGTATSRTYVIEQNKFLDGSMAMTIGVYYERFIEQGGAWKFKFRHWNLQYFGPPDLSGTYFDCKEYGAPPGFPGPDDPTTVRPGVNR